MFVHFLLFPGVCFFAEIIVADTQKLLNTNSLFLQEVRL